MISTRKAAARELTHARLLRKADQGPGDLLGVRAASRKRWRSAPARCNASENAVPNTAVQEAIAPQAIRRARRRRLDGTQEASLIVLACSVPPDRPASGSNGALSKGLAMIPCARWCWPTNSNPGSRSNGAFPPKPMLSLSLTWRICFRSRRALLPPHGLRSAWDEIHTRWLCDIRDPLPMGPGKPARQDDEDERQGACNVFLACEPLRGLHRGQNIRLGACGTAMGEPPTFRWRHPDVRVP